MNILYCGDRNILDGLIISVLSIIKNTSEVLNIYILTMDYKNDVKKYHSIRKKDIALLEKTIKSVNKDSNIKVLNITKIANECLPVANINTRFTPFCMLRLYADLIECLPSKILYLDTDVVCLKDFKELYHMKIDKYEICGVLDYYGSLFFKRKHYYKRYYVNSGVLLINLDLVKETGLFKKARIRCRDIKMFMPDQSALNKLAKHKKILKRKFNEQKKIKRDTVFRHFTTTFDLWPYIHTKTIKPWNIEELHNELNIHCFDDVLEEYQKMIKEIK